MYDEKEKLIAIRNIVKKSKIYFYKEVILFIDKYLNGEIPPNSIIDKSNISAILNIDKIKVSKILSILKKLGVIEKIGNQKYYLKKVSDFKNIAKNWVMDSISNDLDDLNLLFNEHSQITFFQNLDLLAGYSKSNELISTLNLNKNIYQENCLCELLFKENWDGIPNSHKDVIDGSISKYIYELYHTKYLILKKKLDSLSNDPYCSGKFYYITCLKQIKNIFFPQFIDSVKPLPKKNRKTLVYLLNNFRDGIYEFKRYFDKNKFMLIINTSFDRFNGPMILVDNYFLQLYYEDYYSPINSSILYFNNPHISRIISDKFIKLFLTLFRHEIAQFNIFSDFDKMSGSEYGNYLYQLAIKVLDNYIEKIK
ncbi:MAG: hypothetical protein ACTSWR_11435 [Candidatus Helarchaeota archaeon]